MRMRFAMPLLLALAAVPAAPTHAASAVKVRQVCNLVRDTRGDATHGPGGLVRQSNADVVDIVSADIASDKQNLTVAIRLSKLETQSSHVQFGWGYSFEFHKQGFADRLYFKASYDALQRYWFYDYGTVNPDGSFTQIVNTQGVLDTARNEIRITAPLSRMAERVKLGNGARLTDMVVRSWDTYVQVGRYGATQAQDVAPDTGTNSSAYIMGTPSCVPVGK